MDKQPLSSSAQPPRDESNPGLSPGLPQPRKATSTSSLASGASSPGNKDSSLANLSTSPPQRTPSQSSLHKVHRQSFVENLRNVPPSPRAQRHPSFTGIQPSAIQDLLSLASHKMPDPRFTGRDWHEVTLGELVSAEDVKWVDMNTSVEEASMLLVKNSPTNVVLIRDSPDSQAATSTFDYTDLNAYLLVVVGLAHPSEENRAYYEDVANKAQEGTAIALKDIQVFSRKESLVLLPASQDLSKAIEIFGSGIHRILVTNDSGQVVGILNQLKLVEFFWAEGVNFPNIDKLYPLQNRELGIGSQQIMAVNSDSALADALVLMNNEGLTSVAVIDNGNNVVGNISTVDVKHLTNAANAPLLQSSCMHFISVILNERGVEKGRDAFPVFYVNPYQTLAHTVAKLVATQSHRMWVVESASPSPSAPATPAMTSTVVLPTPGAGSTPQSPAPGSTFGSVPAAAMPGAHLSGRLSGVISLTDILNIFAKSSGLHPSDPGEQRARRRRSSSSSVRPSIDSTRASIDNRR